MNSYKILFFYFALTGLFATNALAMNRDNAPDMNTDLVGNNYPGNLKAPTLKIMDVMIAIKEILKEKYPNMDLAKLKEGELEYYINDIPRTEISKLLLNDFSFATNIGAAFFAVLFYYFFYDPTFSIEERCFHAFLLAAGLAYERFTRYNHNMEELGEILEKKKDIWLEPIVTAICSKNLNKGCLE